MSIETGSGRIVDPSNPQKETIDIGDIALALSRLPRFLGHTSVVYSVAQHSVHVSLLVQQLIENERYGGDARDLLLKALLHDAHEAYIGDIPSPIKQLPEFSSCVRHIELRLDAAILSAFDLEAVSDEQRRLIKHADKLAQAIEAYYFIPSKGLLWNLPIPSEELLLNFPAPSSSPADEFLDRFDYLSFMGQ